MKYLQCIIFILMGFIFSSLSQASGKIPKEFRGMKWGATTISNLKKLSGPTSDGVVTYIPSNQKPLSPFLNVTVSEEAYFFSHGKFYSGSLWFEGKDNLEKLKTNLVGEFGKPSFENEKMNIWKWKWPSSKVEISLSYQVKFSKSTVSFTNNAIE